MWIITGEQEYTQGAGGLQAGGWGWGREPASSKMFQRGFLYGGEGWGGAELSHFGHKTQTSPH